MDDDPRTIDWSEQQFEEIRPGIFGATPAGKIPGPEDMTGAALFLASDDAHHVTGSDMIADGGYSMLGA